MYFSRSRASKPLHYRIPVEGLEPGPLQPHREQTSPLQAWDISSKRAAQSTVFKPSHTENNLF